MISRLWASLLLVEPPFQSQVTVFVAKLGWPILARRCETGPARVSLDLVDAAHRIVFLIAEENVDGLDFLGGVHGEGPAHGETSRFHSELVSIDLQGGKLNLNRRLFFAVEALREGGLPLSLEELEFFLDGVVRGLSDGGGTCQQQDH